MDEGIEKNTVAFTLLVATLLVTITHYGIDMHKPYPLWVMDMFAEPLVRFISYVCVYLVACYNPFIAVLLAVILVFLHIDYINLAKN
jgi:hypothetical protein